MKVRTETVRTTIITLDDNELAWLEEVLHGKLPMTEDEAAGGMLDRFRKMLPIGGYTK